MDDQVKKALEELKRFIVTLSIEADLGEEYGNTLWKKIVTSGGALRELAYYHDTGEFLCEYTVAGYTLADILVWQVDHFKAYLDRHEAMNRYRKERLLLESLEVMLKMEEDPDFFADKMQKESGNDSQTY